MTEAARSAEPELVLAPAYDGAKPSFRIPSDMLEDPERLAHFTQIVRDSLPTKKK